jgi:ribonuclease PH
MTVLQARQNYYGERSKGETEKKLGLENVIQKIDTLFNKTKREIEQSSLLTRMMRKSVLLCKKGRDKVKTN